MPLPGLCWFACCRQGFSLLARDYVEKEEEEEESFELRSRDEVTHRGQGTHEVTCSQPSRSTNGTRSPSSIPEEMRSLIIEKNKMGLEEDPELLVKGWLYRDVRGSWIRYRRHWYVLTQDSLDYYSSQDRNARRLGTLVLTRLCSVIWPDKQTYKETGFWNVTVYGRKHCYRLYTKHFNEAVHWACAIQKVIDSKAPVETPTQVLIRDIEENRFDPEVVEHIYQHNPILRYTQSPLYAPLLPFPYGSLDHIQHCGKGYTTVREEAVKVFNSLQQLESAQDPVPLIQGVLQTCLDLPPLRDEVYCQLAKQTNGTPSPEAPSHLRYWQLLTCMSCTFLPGQSVLKYLRFHLKRVQSQYPDTEMDNYASFISEALEKTRCRECVPSWEEIQVLMGRQEMLCVVHYPGVGPSQLSITSHTTAGELVKMVTEHLGLRGSCNIFAMFEQRGQQERVISNRTIIADVLTRFENSGTTKEPDQRGHWRLCFKLYCLLDVDTISTDSIEYIFLFEQCHEMMIRGQLPASEEELQTLAALRLQSLMGDFSTHSPYPTLEELFPSSVVESHAMLSLKGPAPTGCTQRFAGGLLTGTLWSHAHKQRVEQDICLRMKVKEESTAVMAAVLERWKGLGGYSRKDCMAAYLSIARQWSGFGCTLYEVEFYISSTGCFSQKLWLGVSAKTISLYRQGEAEALESFTYTQIGSYSVSDSNTFKITTGDRDLFFETSKLAEIMQLINAYLTAAQLHLEPKEYMYTESSFQPTDYVPELV